jgi:hypothetical protein
MAMAGGATALPAAEAPVDRQVPPELQAARDQLLADMQSHDGFSVSFRKPRPA